MARKWRRKWAGRESKPDRELLRAGSRRQACRPHLEVLESRVLPAWTVVASMPTARSDLAAAVGADGRIFAIGGADASGNPLATVEAYNPDANTWVTVASLNTARTGLAAAEGPDGRIYVIGGKASSGLTNVVEAYTPSNNVWTQVATLPTPRSGLAAAVGADGRIYAIGGMNASGTPLATVEAYTPGTNTWATVVSLTTPRSGLAAAEGTDGRVLAVGGKSTSALTNVVEAFTPGTRRWNTVAALPTLRSGLAATAAADGRVYAIGGADANSTSLGVVEAYTPPPSNSWATVVSLNTPRSGLATAETADGRIFALGGTSGTAPLSNVEVLSVISKVNTSTTILSSVSSSVFGESVIFTATVSGTGPGGSAPTGTVRFQIDGKSTGNPVNVSTSGGATTATFSSATLAVGTHTVTASYSGDNNFASSMATLSSGQTVNKANTATAVTSSANPSVSGQTVVFTAAISITAPGAGTPTGTVQFQIDGSNTGNPVSLSTTSGLTTASFSIASLSVGMHAVTASYSGDGSFAGSNGTLSDGQVVNNQGSAATTISVSSSTNSSVIGQTVTFTATVQGSSTGTPTGTVLFQIDGGNTGNPVSLSTTGGLTTASISTATLSVGTHAVMASYSGDTNFSSSSATLAGGQTVNKAGTATAVTSSANPSLSGQTVTFTATISITAPGIGTPTGTVQFQIDGSNAGSPVSVSTVQGVTTATFSTAALTVGSHTVMATYLDGATLDSSTGSLGGGQVVNMKVPPSNATFLAQIYPDLLHRVPDQSGLATFSSALGQGAIRNQVALAIATSPEYRTDLVESYYSLFLHRAADISGLTAAVQSLTGGGTDEQVQVAITGSPEYFQNRGGGTNDGFLQALYKDALGRAIDPSGLATFSQALAAGMSRFQVAAAIFGSTEFRQTLVQGYYLTFLRRAADSGGLSTFVRALQSGATDEDVIAAMIGSLEYFQRL